MLSREHVHSKIKQNILICVDQITTGVVDDQED